MQAAKPGVSLWRKSHTLFRHLDLSFPRHRLFLKIDVNCLIIPNSLLQYLRYLDEAAPEGPVRLPKVASSNETALGYALRYALKM